MIESNYSNLRLFGYKINELSNGYILAKRPDNTITLFDNKGSVLISKFSEITQLSDFYYRCTDNQGNASLFNKYGKLVDGGLGCNIHIEENYIQLVNKYLNATNLHEMEGKAQFKNVKANIQHIRVQNGNCTLIMTQYPYVYSIDKDGNTYRLPIELGRRPNFNNHYIAYEDTRIGMCGVYDYSGNHIGTHGNCVIDTTSVQSKNIMYVDRENGRIKVIDETHKVSKVVVMSAVDSVDFTSEPNVIWIDTDYGDTHLYNLDTDKKSKSYREIHKEAFICEEMQGSNTNLVRLDRQTLEPISKIDNIRYWEVKDNTLIVTSTVDNETICKYYSLDFRELLHEF